MKNYLFAPFKDNKEKIASFNNLINYLPKGHQSQMRIFVGSLESTYDAEICRLGEEHEHNENIAWGNGKVQELLIVQKGNIARIDELRIENNTLKLNNDKLRSDNAVAVADERVINDLRARLRDETYYSNEYEKKTTREIIAFTNEIKELKAENKRLNDKMGIKIAKEYKKEAEEYFSNNPQCKGVRFHMIDFDDYDYDDNDGLNGGSGEHTHSLYAEDSLIEIDNTHLK